MLRIFFELMVILSVGGFAAAEFFIPLFRNTPLFPHFRFHLPRGRLQSAKEQAREAKERLEAARLKKQALLMEAEADRAEVQGLHAREKAVDEIMAEAEQEEEQSTRR